MSLNNLLVLIRPTVYGIYERHQCIEICYFCQTFLLHGCKTSLRGISPPPYLEGGVLFLI